MLASFRRLSKSTVGTSIMVIILLLILVGFAMGDIQSVIRGGGFGASADTMASVGSERVSDREMSRAMERRLSQVRQENPDADYAAIAGDFDQLLSALIVISTGVEDVGKLNVPEEVGRRLLQCYDNLGKE